MTSSFDLVPVPPFDFAQSLAFIGEFPVTMGEQRIEPLRLTRALRVRGQTVVVTITALGSIEQPRLSGLAASDQPIVEATRAAIEDQVGFFLSVSDDLGPFYERARKDAPFAPVLTRLYGYHQVKFASPFENACWAILSQRTSLAVARRWKQQLAERFGGRLVLDGNEYQAFPEPDDLAQASADEVMGAVGNDRKATYVLGAAKAFRQVETAFLRTAPTAFVEQWLRTIPGIGVWSASFILLRGLGRIDQPIPTDGSALFTQEILRAARKVYGEALTLDEFLRLAEHYGPTQGYWAHYLRAAS